MVASLQKELAALREENDRLREENRALRDEVAPPNLLIFRHYSNRQNLFLYGESSPCYAL